MPKETAAITKLIAVSSVGLMQGNYAKIPFLFKYLYGTVFHSLLSDKLGMERVVAHAANKPWTDEEPAAGFLPDGWKSQLPQPGFLKDALIIRVAKLMNDECIADEKGLDAYHVSTKELSGSTISREDVGHFIVEQALKNWSKYNGWVFVSY